VKRASVYQPYVRPILRGKDKAKVEFGAKINDITIRQLFFVFFSGLRKLWMHLKDKVESFKIEKMRLIFASTVI
jgi:hypothetical protein